MRRLLFLLLFLLGPTAFTFADNSGYGCMVGEHWVYTSAMGTAKVTGAGNETYRYFNYNAFKIPVYPGYGQNLHRGYRCGYINRYPASSYYDSTIPPYGGTVQIPAEQEYTLMGSPCVVSTTLGGQPMATDGQSGMGQYVYYSYNKTGKCGGPPTNVPLDDYVGFLLIPIALIGFLAVRQNIFSLS